MSARAYFMKRVKNCKDVSIISPQAEQWRWPSLFCNFLILLSTTVCSQNINKQSVNIAHETLTDYSFLSRYHYTKSKNYFKRRYWIRHWIPMFIGTPCTLILKEEGGGSVCLNIHKPNSNFRIGIWGFMIAIWKGGGIVLNIMCNYA